MAAVVKKSQSRDLGGFVLNLCLIGAVIGMLMILVIGIGWYVYDKSKAPNQEQPAYAEKIESPIFADIDGDGDADLILPGGYIIRNTSP